MNLRTILIALATSLVMTCGVAMAGGPADHAFFAFQYLNKPLDKITFIDQANAVFSHAWVDGVVAENGKNLVFYQSAALFVSYEKAKSIGMGKQYKMALRDGNLFDVIDKALTGGAIEYQLEQIPVVGDTLSLLVPHLVQNELIHTIPGYPEPSYQFTEGQYFWYQVFETSVFCLECDYLKVSNNRIYGELDF